MLRENNSEPRILRPVELSFKNEHKNKNVGRHSPRQCGRTTATFTLVRRKLNPDGRSEDQEPRRKKRY